jgi:hypothetical protein
MRVLDWQEQLNVGDVGEKDFVKYYSELKPIKSKDLSVDFWIKNGWSVELKTDTYDMNRTPNFFMELYGDITTKKLGGPWRASRDCLNLFCYYFKTNKTFFWYEPKMLTSAVDEIIQRNRLTTVEIPNKGWTSEGYKIRRDDLNSILLKRDVFPN